MTTTTAARTKKEVRQDLMDLMLLAKGAPTQIEKFQIYERLPGLLIELDCPEHSLYIQQAQAEWGRELQAHSLIPG